MADLSRAEFLARGLRGGVVLAAGGAALGLVVPALADDTVPGPPEEDLALIRLAASAELLADAFYSRAIGGRKFEKAEQGYLVAARANEREHYDVLAKALGDAAPVADDFQFSFPSGAFRSAESTAKLGVALETMFVGVYVGAAGTLETAELRALAASIAASEATHLSALSGLRGESPIGSAFPRALDVEQASDALAAYLGD